MGPRLEVFSLHTMEPPFNFPIKAIIKFLQLAGIEALNMEVSEGEKKTS